MPVGADPEGGDPRRGIFRDAADTEAPPFYPYSSFGLGGCILLSGHRRVEIASRSVSGRTACFEQQDGLLESYPDPVPIASGKRRVNSV